MVDLDTVVCQNDCSGHGKCQQSTRYGHYIPFNLYRFLTFSHRDHFLAVSLYEGMVLRGYVKDKSTVVWPNELLVFFLIFELRPDLE